ncbi:excalibur calcium-binding domain-containing protein [Nakamurella leprariae]|uniref:excalibur calcium-binding domain-containing protein n=1 Tax=Nakamurella leprariae TaxID=2803911 RepID=UPI002E284561|nr:excalibur calcium-binding domain-containing protein [Nakamurella leprariae]
MTTETVTVEAVAAAVVDVPEPVVDVPEVVAEPDPTPIAAAVAPARTSQAPAAPPAPAASASVSYKNCDAVKAAGAAPLYRSDPGYSSKLDRDGDGVACET